MIFSTDENTIKDPTPLGEKARRRKNKRNLVISVPGKKKKNARERRIASCHQKMHCVIKTT